MGLIRGSVTLANPTRPELVPLPVSALADTGAVHLCIPEHLAIQLELAELERREVVLADGRRRTVPYVGPVEVRFGNRRCRSGAAAPAAEPGGEPRKPEPADERGDAGGRRKASASN
jgi:clan AA aspartic protease